MFEKIQKSFKNCYLILPNSNKMKFLIGEISVLLSLHNTTDKNASEIVSQYTNMTCINDNTIIINIDKL